MKFFNKRRSVQAEKNIRDLIPKEVIEHSVKKIELIALLNALEIINVENDYVEVLQHATLLLLEAIDLNDLQKIVKGAIAEANSIAKEVSDLETMFDLPSHNKDN